MVMAEEQVRTASTPSMIRPRLLGEPPGMFCVNDGRIKAIVQMDVKFRRCRRA